MTISNHVDLNKKPEIPVIKLRNLMKLGIVKESVDSLYYPRLQVNPLYGLVVLSLYKSSSGLTNGILVKKVREPAHSKMRTKEWGKGKTARSLSIGTHVSDWEIWGALEDYDGNVTIKFQNETKAKDVR